MKDTKALAYCNLYAILGSIPMLLQLDEKAAKYAKGKNVSLGFDVKNGPKATLAFKDGKAELREGVEGCSIRLYFPSCEKFNGLIDGTAMPIPVSGFKHLPFLLRNFTKITDILTEYLRATPEALKNKDFLVRSTTLMLHVVATAVEQLGNNEKVAMFSASNMVDGDVHIGIGDDVTVGIRVRNHKLSVLHDVSNEGPAFSDMRFVNFETARDLFDGKINSLVAVGLGNVRIGGMISQVDNLNRILDRVSLYLA